MTVRSMASLPGLIVVSALTMDALVAAPLLTGTQTTMAALTSASTAVAESASGVSFDGTTYTNRLIDSHDPYLLLHADNPVDWYPWEAAAIEKAKRENKPIFLSLVGHAVN